tara:strand:+ start:76 stop:501 length:426 start_codon:yes stop_codon:yes gene_type:complete
MKFRHVGLVVKDFNKQLYFYRDILGLEVYSNETERGDFLNKILDKDNYYAEIAKLGYDGQTIIELLKFNRQYNYTNNCLFSKGYTHFALEVINIKSLYKKLKKHRISFLSEPSINKDGNYKVCFCRDPEQNHIELVECLKS